METAPLKNFATWARTALVREVTARIAAVLAPASTERVEQAKGVAALEKAVTAAGGGEKGRAAVADKVAYTWFNRIVALRFMDAKGYTGIGVVSPQAGIEVGQPEVLAEAKRGVIDSDVVNQATRTAVAGLLDGTRTSGDPQGEAYALLLADYCRHWNRSMPFMFERERDFTELLIPANLLADDSVLDRAVKVLTSDVCRDVEVIGWLYQFYISERKDEVFAGFKKNKKAGADEIPAATQLFTPRWIVRYLVENSLGRLWMLNRRSSRLVDQMDYYIAPVDEETDFLKITKPEELKVIDPACGSGHMLTYAFDLLYAIYEEEGYAPSEIPSLILANNLYGTEIDPRAGALAAFALTMKARAKQRTFLNKQAESNVCVIEPISFGSDELDFLATRGGDRYEESAFWNQFAEADTFGSLIRPDADLTIRLARHLESLEDGGEIYKSEAIEWGHRVVAQAKYLAERYCVVVANPPYMGSKNMASLLGDFARHAYPDSKADLFAMFIERCRTLAGGQGLVGMITMQSWMFLQSFEALRSQIVHGREVTVLAHLGTGAFDTIGGDVVSTCAFVLSSTHSGRSVFMRLTDASSEASKRDLLVASINDAPEARYEVDLQSIEGVPGSPIAYWLRPSLITSFSVNKSLASIGTAAVGVQSSDTVRFTRQWHEVSLGRTGFGCSDREEAARSGKRWFPVNSGGDFRRWYGNQELVMNWENDGEEIRNFKDESGRLRSRPQNLEYMFRPAVSWSAVGSGTPTFRYFPAGYLFDNAGISFFPSSDGDLAKVLGYVNSTPVYELLSGISPTMNLNAGQMGSIPFPESLPDSTESAVWELVDIFQRDWDSRETSFGFSQPIWAGRTGALRELLEDIYADDVLTRRRAAQLEVTVSDDAASQLGAEAFAVPKIDRVSLWRNPAFRFSADLDSDRHHELMRTDDVRDLVSYAVGCMFARYSLDEPGLVVADQGATLQDYLAKVPMPTFSPDADNVIPIVDGDWFEDDIVARFRQFLRTAFGEEHFEENLRFITDSLGVKNLRDYFVKLFYKDHVQRYKKRPIYWLFSSPKGSFNALVYMHRYTPSTVSTVLNEYLREFQAKLKASLEHAERSNNAKEADRLRKVLLELDEYEHDVLYPLASQNIAIDLDDGVKANYAKFGAALKKIPGLEATE